MKIYRIKQAMLATLAIALILSGCALQPNVENTGAIVFSAGPATSAIIGSGDLSGQNAYVRFYLLKGSKFYDTTTEQFRNDPFFVDIGIGGVGSSSTTIDGLSPGSDYQVYAAVGVKESSTSALLKVHSYASATNIAVVAGDTTLVELPTGAKSGINYVDSDPAISGIATSPTVYVLTEDAEAGTTALSSVSGSVSEPELSTASISGFTGTLGSLGKGRYPGLESEVVFLNTDTKNGIYRYDGSSTVALGPNFTESSRITRSDSYFIEAEEGSEDGDSAVLFYQSTSGIGFAFVDEDTAANEIDWFDPADPEEGVDLPDTIDLSVFFRDYVLTDGFGVFATTIGTFFVNDDTIDDIVKEDDDDPNYIETNDDDNIVVYKEGGDPNGTELTNPLDILDEITLQSVPDGESIRAVEAASDRLILLGSDQGLFFATTTDDEPPELTTGSDDVVQVTRVTGSLQRRVQRLSANGAGKAAVLYGNGTIDIVSVTGTSATVSASLQRPFFAGLPGVPRHDGQKYNSTVKRLVWDGNSLYILGEYGTVRYDTGN
jgi:hypothetical protein